MSVVPDAIDRNHYRTRDYGYSHIGPKKADAALQEQLTALAADASYARGVGP